MRILSIPLRAENPAVRLDGYLLHDSPEFQTGMVRPAVLICPGGAYLIISDREAEPVALRFLAAGYHAFVLRYSVGARFPAPMLDLAQAILLLRSRAAEWRIDPAQVVLCGFSAGGHLCASLGVLWNHPVLTEPLGVAPAAIRPDGLILGYPVIDLMLVSNPAAPWEGMDPTLSLRELVNQTTLGESSPTEEQLALYRADAHVSPETPPTFLWHTADDELVPVENSLRFALALARHGVSCELHIYPHGVHGLALADETTDVAGQFLNPVCQSWISHALAWMQRPDGRAHVARVEA